MQARVFTAATAVAAGPFTGSTMIDIATVTDPGAAWQEMASPITVPSTHQWLRMFLNVDAPAGSTQTVWWDDATVKQAS